MFQNAQAFTKSTKTLTLDYHGPYLALSHARKLNLLRRGESSVSTLVIGLDI